MDEMIQPKQFPEITSVVDFGSAFNVRTMAEPAQRAVARRDYVDGAKCPSYWSPIMQDEWLHLDAEYRCSRRSSTELWWAFIVRSSRLLGQPYVLKVALPNLKEEEEGDELYGEIWLAGQHKKIESAFGQCSIQRIGPCVNEEELVRAAREHRIIIRLNEMQPKYELYSGQFSACTQYRWLPHDVGREGYREITVNMAAMTLCRPSDGSARITLIESVDHAKKTITTLVRDGKLRCLQPDISLYDTSGANQSLETGDVLVTLERLSKIDPLSLSILENTATSIPPFVVVDEVRE